MCLVRFTIRNISSTSAISALHGGKPIVAAPPAPIPTVGAGALPAPTEKGIRHWLKPMKIIDVYETNDFPRLQQVAAQFSSLA